MPFTLAEAAATTVIETVTVTPPNIPVEIVKQPSSGWALKDILSPVIALLALGVSILTWKAQGAVPKFKTYVWGTFARDAKVRISLTNFGRLEAVPGPVGLCGPGIDYYPVTEGDFVPVYDEDEIEQKPLFPGNTFTADMSLDEIASFVPRDLKDSTTLRSFYFDTWVSGKAVKIKVSRKDARKWQASFNSLVESNLTKREKEDAEIRQLIEEGILGEDMVGEVGPPIPKEKGFSRIKTWFRTLK